jgi:acyl-CoA reductase-like NAD-dependent aldehyde dehydrogenase
MEYKIYLAGEFKTTDQKLPVENPHTQKVFATTYLAGNTEFEIATQAAVKSQKTMATLPAYKKYEILRSVSDQLRTQKEKLAHILAQESGKPLIYALAEIDRAAETFLIAAEEAKRIPGEEHLRLDWTPAGENQVGIVKQFPIGPVAGIAPFNFPLNLAVHKIAPAIATGCPIVLKPASSTPLSTLELAKILDQTGLPKGAVSILPMDRNTGNQLVTDPRYKLLSFTGSPVVGWKMKQDAGEKKVVLELGGNAGVIIAQSANLEKSLPSCLMGGFSYAGQVCIHAQRYFVHESKFDDFTQAMKKGVESLTSGDPTEKSTQFSAMIDEKNAQRIESWVEEALELGAEMITGGPRKGTYYPPTILTSVPKQAKVVAEEAFGPVVVIEKFKHFQEALNQINAGKFGLQAGVYTEQIDELQQAFDQLEVGGVIHNNVPTFRVDHMPYGGVKQSGLGREGVKYAMMDMLEPRVLVRRG